MYHAKRHLVVLAKGLLFQSLRYIIDESHKILRKQDRFEHATSQNGFFSGLHFSTNKSHPDHKIQNVLKFRKAQKWLTWQATVLSGEPYTGLPIT